MRRAFAGVDLATLDPFIHMDQMGEVEYAPGEPKGTAVAPAPRLRDRHLHHRRRRSSHQDSHGGGGMITNGDTQWMTAGGRACCTSRRRRSRWSSSGGLFHGLQLWVNLPSEQKWAAPRYQDLRGQRGRAARPRADGGALVRVIAGDVAGHAGPGSTHTPMTMVHATRQPGRAARRCRGAPDFNALAYVLAGDGTVGAERRPVAHGSARGVRPRRHHHPRGGDASRRAGSPQLEVVLLGGRPIREPVAWMGPFVMNTKAEVQQAFEDYQAGRLGQIPADGIHPYRG